MSIFDDFDEALASLDFVYDEDGLAYTKADGFIYTVSLKRSCVQVGVNLPAVNRNEKRMISGFLLENANYIKSIGFVKEGVIIRFGLFVFDDPAFISDLTKHFSSFLNSVSIEFLNPDLNIRKGGHGMYIFDSVVEGESVEKEADEATENDDAPSTHNVAKFIMENKIIALALFGIIFFAVSLAYVKVASAVGYVMGSVVALMYVASNDKRAFLKSALYCAATLVISGIAIYFTEFLTQTELYTFYEFTIQSLNIEYCLFNVVVGSLLALLAVYSTVPAKRSKKKKQDEEADF